MSLSQDPTLYGLEGLSGKGSASRSYRFPLSRSPIIFKYNPQQMGKDEVLGTLVERADLIQELIRHIRSQRHERRPKHILFYGPRGIGKTTILLALRYTIEDNPGLKASFDILQFNEEERRISNLPSFAVRTLELLAEARPEIERALEKARNNYQKAMDILLEVAGRKSDRQAVLLMDNFDEIALAAVSVKGKQIKGTSKDSIRAFEGFLASPGFIIIATAIQSPEKRKKFQGIKGFLASFCRIFPLESLSDPMAFIRRRAERDEKGTFLKNLSRFSGRIEGLNRLAAGNPRLLAFLYECLGDRPVLDLVEIVQRVIDDLTPMYQDVIDRLLNRGQAAVLEMLALNGGV